MELNLSLGALICNIWDLFSSTEHKMSQNEFNEPEWFYLSNNGFKIIILIMIMVLKRNSIIPAGYLNLLCHQLHQH